MANDMEIIRVRKTVDGIIYQAWEHLCMELEREFKRLETNPEDMLKWLGEAWGGDFADFFEEYLKGDEGL